MTANTCTADSLQRDRSHSHKNREIQNKKHNILQINIAGIISPSNMTQTQKCKYLYDIIKSKNIDIILLQEWSILRFAITPNNPIYIGRDGRPHTADFPISHFPHFKVHWY